MTRAACLLLAALPLAAAPPPPAPGAPPDAGTVRIASKILGEERTLFVATPDGYARGAARYPVLFLTDGGTEFDETRATADFLRRNGFMPAVLVVGVLNTDRTRDLAPPSAGRFLDFFEKELVPFVEASWRTVPFRIFCGHSLGAVFGIHALLTRPSLFNAVVAASPPLAWNGGAEGKRLAGLLAGAKGPKRTLFVTTGSEGAESRAAFEAFRSAAEAGGAAGLRFGSGVFPEEDHFSVVLVSNYAGLKMIFEGWHIPRANGIGDLQAGSLADLKARFAAVSERTGFAFQPPEALLRLLARQALARKEPEQALLLLRYDVETYPESADARAALAAALAAAEKPAEVSPR